MNYETFIKEGEHLKTKLTKLTKEERTSTREDLAHLLDGYIFYPISTWPPSIKEIMEYNTITDRNTFKLLIFAYGNGTSSNVFIEYLYTFILNTTSKIKKRTHQIHWIFTNINKHQHKWYYFEMYHRSLLSLNGCKKN